ncbi:Uncharacterised protein [Mycobacteroides abscessus subsp. abscessus]|jgi:protein-S-isoprenylcysteine O-methyltransferase Ste14|uniref:hypothetical protein n=1 Tax=Mycobacteroides abscessus TaxID=36809 RepID=UPI00092C0479|nr:hypothetical protein [Mycobacteroides abscessus]SIH38808.1 Uncharacterised protein [Mycobacteroides abscessus subsp. abscessus]
MGSVVSSALYAGAGLFTCATAYYVHSVWRTDLEPDASSAMDRAIRRAKWVAAVPLLGLILGKPHPATVWLYLLSLVPFVAATIAGQIAYQRRRQAWEAHMQQQFGDAGREFL